MNEVLIVMGAIIVLGILPVIAVAFLAMRALAKSFERMENQLDTRFEKFEESMEKIDDVIAEQEESISKTVAKIKRK